jgi:alpha-D-xyloside xylohydrolase
MQVLFDKQTGSISFANREGRLFLDEKEGSRKLTSNSIRNESCFIAEQSFKSPADECLFGLGQFQDGQYNLRGITRRFQWGAFNPVFRIHGYQSETEPWKYGPTVENNMRKMLNLRYRLLPYIYSEAWQITHYGSTIMRPLVMDFSEDATATRCQYEFMLGKSILVAPITEPGVDEWEVYLPKSTDWYDFWTGNRSEGGQTVKTTASPDKIPLFVKSGSVLPMGKLIQYAYEKGEYTIIPFKWNEKYQSLTIGKRQGSYPGCPESRIFNVVLVSEAKGAGMPVSKVKRLVSYTGKDIKIKINQNLTIL